MKSRLSWNSDQDFLMINFGDFTISLEKKYGKDDEFQIRVLGDNVSKRGSFTRKEFSKAIKNGLDFNHLDLIGDTDE